MTLYHGEVADIDNWEVRHRVVEVEADGDEEALEKVINAAEGEEGVYQITTAIEGCELEQPIWDFLYGFLRSKDEE